MTQNSSEDLEYLKLHSYSADSTLLNVSSHFKDADTDHDGKLNATEIRTYGSYLKATGHFNFTKARKPHNHKFWALRHFCAHRYSPSAMPGETETPGETEAKWTNTQDKNFWQNWDYHKERHNCEYDNRCIFFDLKWYGNHQGRYRCVPRIHREDPRYFVEVGRGKLEKEFLRYKPPAACAKLSGGEAANCGKDSNCFCLFTKTAGCREADGSNQTESMKQNRCMQQEGRFWLNNAVAQGMAALDQTALAKWQRPVQPFLGQPQGSFMASLYPVYGEMAAKAYVQAGEICLNYRLNATYGEEVNGYLPPTRARCTSGQYRIFNDQLQLGICLRLSPAGMGKYIVDVLKPILEKLPGNLYETIGPGMAGWIARKVGKALDKAFSQGLFLPIIGPILGLLYETAMVIMKNWFSVDLRNLLTNDDPAKNA